MSQFINQEMNHTDDTGNVMSDELRHYYLQTMGIQSWVLRQSRQIAGSFDRETSTITLATLEKEVTACTRCGLCSTATSRIVAEGETNASLMLVLQSPDSNGLVTGRLMHTESRALLEKMLAAIDISLSNVYLTTLLKCDVPAGHTIMPAEVKACSNYLDNQIALVQPDILFVMGETTAQCILESHEKLDALREQTYTYACRQLMVSYAPQSLIENPQDKRKAWNDLQQLKRMLQTIKG